MKKIFNYVKDMLLDFLFPPCCLVCEKYIEERRNFLCSECNENILNVDRSPKKKPPLIEVWRVTKYREGTREIVRSLKFKKGLNKLPLINKILNRAITEKPYLKEFLNKIDLAAAVPLHKSREKKRGFNQVELIFGDWLKRQNIPMERLILRNRATEHLYSLKPEERQKEISGAFSLVNGAETKIKSKKILILDDIFTTGTTMGECAKVFEDNGAAEIYGLTFSSDF